MIMPREIMIEEMQFCSKCAAKMKGNYRLACAYFSAARKGSWVCPYSAPLCGTPVGSTLQ